jgi:hypothetical protein
LPFGTFSSNICNGLVGLSFRIGPLSFLQMLWIYRIMKAHQMTTPME